MTANLLEDVSVDSSALSLNCFAVEHSITQEKDKWILSFSTGRHFIVNDNALSLLNILKQSATVDDAYQTFILKKDNEATSYDDFVSVTKHLINKFKSNQNTYHQTYLKLKLSLIKKDNIKFFTAPFMALFSLQTFYFLFILSFVFNIFSVWEMFNKNFEIDLFSNFEVIVSGLFLATFLHEIGHMTACRKHGASHGDMGVGFYFIFPVAYADVTGIWALTKGKRIQVNLSGIYLELLLVSCFFVFSVFFPSIVYACVFIMFRIIYTIIPFFRSDGYWLLSDFISEPNLQKKSIDALKSFLNKKETSSYSKKYLFLILYGFLSIIYFPVFIFYIAFNYTNTLISTPYIIQDIIARLFNKEDVLNLLTYELFIAIVFYVLLISKVLPAFITKLKLRYKNNWKLNQW